MADITQTKSIGGRRDFFTIGFDDGALWHAWDDGKVLHEWESLGGKLTSAPVAQWSKDANGWRLDVYARGNISMQHLAYTEKDGWLPWEDMGGRLGSGPAIADLPAASTAAVGSSGPAGPTGPSGPPGPPGPAVDSNAFSVKLHRHPGGETGPADS